jgi:hypothetical protein
LNRNVGLWSSVAVTASVVLFASCMIVGQDYGAYAMSMFIAWGYLLMVCSFSAASRATEAVAAQAGVAFGVLYAGFVTTVYFVQLTTVLHQSAGADILKVLTYRELGSLMFNLDLLGYGLMSISTFFIGLTVISSNATSRWLRWLLIVHGVFAPMCVALPIIDVFTAMPRSSGDATGIAVLLFWCAYFTPVGVLAIRHFETLKAPDHQHGLSR